ELLQHPGFFVGTFTIGKSSELAIAVRLQAIGDQPKGLIPGDFEGLAIGIARAWVGEAIGALHPLVTPLALLTHVAVVDAALPHVGGAANEALVRLDVDGAANIAETADGLGGVQFPRVVAEVAVGEGTYRAHSDTHTAVHPGTLGDHV